MKGLRIFFVVSSLTHICAGFLLFDAINGISNILQAAWEQYDNEPDDTIFVKKEYDFIIVGAGSAGCVVAARLAENPDFDVLLIEAGGQENFYADVPVLAPYLRNTNMDWQYFAAPSPERNYCASMVDGKCSFGRGKVVGGSSAINYQFYTRGNRGNFDYWSELGNEGWSYEEVLPYFQKIEDFHIDGVDMEYHGTGGPVYVGYPNNLTSFGQIAIEASKQFGFDEVDYNGEQQNGVSRVQGNIKNGIRQSASRAYLHPIKNKKNFSLKKLSMVKRVLINPATKQAYGVEFVNSGFTYQVKVRKEVILSAGAVNSPQILMLSGVGPKEHLQEMQIPLILDSPVGQDSMDHIFGNPIVYQAENVGGFKLNVGSVLQYADNFTGVLASSVMFETLIFTNVDDVHSKSAVPNIELVFLNNILGNFPLLLQGVGIPTDITEYLYGELKDAEVFSITPLLIQPKSRGKVLLRDNKYDSPPIIAPNYFNSTEDLQAMLRATRLSMALAEQAAFKPLKPRLWKKQLKACEEYDFESDEYLVCVNRHLGVPLIHLVGTCRMGPDSDPLAVVDSELRVKGIESLRVIDASIMPHIPAAHTSSPAMMVGEKGADLIKDTYS